MKRSIRSLIGPSASLVLFGAAVFLLWRSLRDVRWIGLWQALGDIPLHSVLAAIALTAASHVALSVYDYFGVRYIRRRIPYRRVLLAAFTAYSISHALGFPAVTGGTVRYRMYSRWRLNGVEIAQLMGVSAICLFLGLFEISGFALLLDGRRAQEWSGLPSAGVNALGALLICLVALYGVLPFVRRSPVRLWRFELPIPRPGFALIQIAVGGADWFSVGAVLYCLLPPNHVFTFSTFLGVFVAAYLLGVASNVPGGLGVFESIIVISMHHAVPTEAIVSSLLVYRAIYYVLPLLIGGAIFVTSEVKRNHRAWAGRSPDRPTAGLRHAGSRAGIARR